MSLPEAYFPSVRPSAIVFGTVFEHVSSFIVYGPLFGQTWQKAMNADKVWQSPPRDVIDLLYRTRSSGRAKKPRMLLLSTDLLSFLLVSRYVFCPMSWLALYWLGVFFCRLMQLQHLYNSLELIRTRELRHLQLWSSLPKLFHRLLRHWSMRSVLLVM